MAKSKIYNLVNPTGESLYTIKVKTKKNGNIKYTLRYSQHGLWNYPGQRIISIEDDGNGMNLPRMETYMDYSALGDFHTLMSAIQAIQGNLFYSLKVTECRKVK